MIWVAGLDDVIVVGCEYRVLSAHNVFRDLCHTLKIIKKNCSITLLKGQSVPCIQIYFVCFSVFFLSSLLKAVDHLESFIADCDRRTELAKKRLAETQEEISAEVAAKVTKNCYNTDIEIHIFNTWILSSCS